MKNKNEVEQINLALGLYIKEKRERLNYTQEQIATMLEISVPAYNRYENGQRGIGINTLVKLSDILRFSVDDFLVKYGDRR